MTWRVVSYYNDGELIIESLPYKNRKDAEWAAVRIREWREDQEELPWVVVEEIKP